MVRVKVTETYDLKTQVGKTGIIGIHTPNTQMIARVWGSAIKSHTHMRLAGCNVTMACASVLPADPLQIGVEAGQIAPEDMFNPILYKAVSNEGYDTIVNRIYANSDLNSYGGSVNGEYDTTTDIPINVYYSLLAEGRFKKAMPQTGFSMRGLKPLVHEMYQTYGSGLSSQASSSALAGDVGVQSTTDLLKLPNGSGAAITGANRIIRGKARPMPAIPTNVVYPSTGSGTVQEGSFPKTYCAIIITPPAVLNEFYFRLKVTWFIDLVGLRSDLVTAALGTMGTAGASLHLSYYTSTSKLDNEESMVDSANTSLEPIMSGDR